MQNATPSIEEQVLVIPKREIDKLGYFHGIRTDRKIFLNRFFGINSETLGLGFNLDSEVTRFKWMNRSDAEKDFQHKQLVVYVLIMYKNEIIRFSRGEETSLRDNLGKYSIGIGGHVDNKDQDAFHKGANAFAYACLQCVKREVLEETGINVDKNQKNLTAIGFLNDDSVKQGLQHVALVLLLELSTREVYQTENQIVKPHFVPVEKLADDFSYYEYWSQLCIQAFWGRKLRIENQIVRVQNFELKHQSSIILIVGFIGSGKSVACKLLEKEFGYVHVRCSKIMADIIGYESIESLERRSLQEAGYKLVHSENGHDRLAQGIIEFMSRNPGKHYVLDGLRYVETFSILARKLNKPITIIYVDKLIENCWRHHSDSIHINVKPTFNDYLTMIYHPVEKHIQDFRPIANIVIHNNGSLNSYLSTLREFFKKEIN
ncbi:MAG: NUDIX domain-containing protein [Anaerolineales bacterium]|nr:MAG: NUDIX domain-containing protein [Anaerolineales bacterium]